MRRRCSAFFSAALLALCALTAVMWAASYFRQIGVQTLLRSDWGGEVVASRGRLFAFAFHFQGFYRVANFGVICEPYRDVGTLVAVDEIVGISRQGHIHRVGDLAVRWEPTFVYAMLAPMWFVLLVFLAMFLTVRRLRGVRNEGSCLGCGYDLTGNVSGVCPEGGTEIRRGKVEA